MNIPETVNLGWRTYKIEQGEHRSDVNGDLYGEIKYEDNKIFIYRELDNDNKAVTLLHEMIHWIFYNAGQEDWRKNENLIECLSENLYQIIKANPELFERKDVS